MTDRSENRAMNGVFVVLMLVIIGSLFIGTAWPIMSHDYRNAWPLGIALIGLLAMGFV